ncbi:LysR family transcriptional regulator [uncultured Amaricoccus sp.]|uniref:LysR family transcriptional regulator n=1 Tax=uncultured Amaricoccus sp. TaxID=339341 RepID=UPI002622702E|nr:LysR family transcriptional regulator [uncultured Amaricoccus sp.]
MDWQTLPPLNSLRAFAAVAEHRGFSQAGRALNVSHAAVSQQVRALERRLGAGLVMREGRGLTLTPAGARLARALDNAFGEIALAVDALTGADVERPLQITCTPSFAASWLMPRIADFRQRHPEVELMINPTPMMVEFVPGGVDVALRYGGGDWSGLAVEPLFPSDIAVVASRRLVGDKRIEDPADLLDYPWLQEAGTSEISTWLTRHGVTPDRRVSITHLPGHHALEATRRGEGISAVASVFVAEDVAAGRLVVLFQDSQPGAGYYIVTRPGVMRPPLKSFVTWLRRQRLGSGAGHA